MIDESQSEAGIPVVDGWDFQVILFHIVSSSVDDALEVLLQVGHP